MTVDQWDGQDRRVGEESFAEWRKHVDRRLDKQDETLQEIRAMLGASKFGLAAIKWLIAVGGGVVAIMSFWSHLK